MELKYTLRNKLGLSADVLIVPCGIEIKNLLVCNVIHQVLIVPCGIEIGQRTLLRHIGFRVLIVPCGIEIIIEELAKRLTAVLIVPCGIEIWCPSSGQP